jgi:hypothetical protein
MSVAVDTNRENNSVGNANLPITLRYIGGPLDGDTELRDSLPRPGEPVHRLVSDRYYTYVWQQGVFVAQELLQKRGDL